MANKYIVTGIKELHTQYHCFEILPDGKHIIFNKQEFLEKCKNGEIKRYDKEGNKIITENFPSLIKIIEESISKGIYKEADTIENKKSYESLYSEIKNLNSLLSKGIDEILSKFKTNAVELTITNKTTEPIELAVEKTNSSNNKEPSNKEVKTCDNIFMEHINNTVDSLKNLDELKQKSQDKIDETLNKYINETTHKIPNCLKYALLFNQYNHKYKIYYNSEHCINLHETDTKRPKDYLELATNYTFQSIVDSFSDIFENNDYLRELLSKYYRDNG